MQLPPETCEVLGLAHWSNDLVVSTAVVGLVGGSAMPRPLAQAYLIRMVYYLGDDGRRPNAAAVQEIVETLDESTLQNPDTRVDVRTFMGGVPALAGKTEHAQKVTLAHLLLDEMFRRDPADGPEDD